MGIAKPTADPVRLQAPAEAALSPANGTIIAFCQLASEGAIRDTIWNNLAAAVGGQILRNRGVAAPADVLEFIVADTNAGNQTQTHAFDWGAVLGTDVVIHARWDTPAKTLSVGVNGAYTSSAYGFGWATTIGEPAKLFTRGGAFDAEFLGRISEFIMIGRAISDAELDSIRLSHGALVSPESLLVWLRGCQAAPGVTAAAQAPVDLADPSRAWAQTGAGDALTWTEATAGCLRRRVA